MPIAKARLFGEMTVQRLVEELASVWGDDENHVLALLAGLLDEDRQQRSDEGIAFYYRHRLDEKNENGSVNYHPLKIPFGGKSYIIHALHETAANDEWGMEDKRFYVVADEYKLKNLSREQRVFGQLNTLPETFNIEVSLRDIFVNKFDITSFLLAKNLLVPQDWREMVVSAGGLTQSAQSKGGRRSKIHVGLQNFLNDLYEKFKRDSTPFTLSKVTIWLEKNATTADRHRPGVPGCDEIYYDADKVSCVNEQGEAKHFALRSLEPYLKRAKSK